MLLIQTHSLFLRRDFSTTVKFVTAYIDPLSIPVPFRFLAFTLPFPRLPILRHSHLQLKYLSHQSKKLILASSKFNRNSFRRVKDGCRKNTSFAIQQQTYGNSTQSNDILNNVKCIWCLHHSEPFNSMPQYEPHTVLHRLHKPTDHAAN